MPQTALSHLQETDEHQRCDSMASRDPSVCIDAILQRLGDRPGALRGAINRFDWTPYEPALRGCQEVAHEWAMQMQRLARLVDDGQGLPGPDGQRLNVVFGVAGMEGRAAVLGGTLILQPSTLGGLAVPVDVPCLGARELAGCAP